MTGGIRIYIGKALRWLGLIGLILGVPAATLSAIISDTRWLDVGGVLLFSLAYAVVGHLLYLSGISARARRHDQMLIASRPPGTVVAMLDHELLTRMMATVENIAEHTAAGREADAHLAEQELNRLMKQDPATTERLVDWLQS